MNAMQNLVSAASGNKAWEAIKQKFREVQSTAPNDHDIFIEAFGAQWLSVAYIKPNAFIFSEPAEPGHTLFTVCHLSQLVFTVVHFPRRDPQRRISILSGAV